MNCWITQLIIKLYEANESDIKVTVVQWINIWIELWGRATRTIVLKLRGNIG